MENIMYHVFQTVEKEHGEPVPAAVTGEIPHWIHGSFYRNGPAKFEFGNDSYNHWFDGSAMVHRFFFKDGQVTYQNRFLQTDSYLKNTAANRIVVSEFGTLGHPDPCKTLFERFFSYFFPGDITDNTLVNIFPIGDAMYAATETQFMRKFDPKSLQTEDKVDLLKVAGVNMATAHPHIDEDGNIYNLGSCREGGYSYAIFKMSPPATDGSSVVESSEIVAKVKPYSKFCPSYFHSFAITENYYVIVEQPAQINVLKILTSHILGRSFQEAITWDENFKNIFHVIERKTGKPVNEGFTYVSRDQFLTFHHGNAYEENGHLIIDLCGLEDGDIFNAVTLERLRQVGPFFDSMGKEQHPTYRRYVLPLHIPQKCEENENLVKLTNCIATAHVLTNQIVCHYDVIDEGPIEFPQVNYKRNNGKKYRYLYGNRLGSEKNLQIVKVDVETKEIKSWSPNGGFQSEPIFVEAPDAEAEDDGVLLSVVLVPGQSEEQHQSFVVVLDAKTMTEVGRATVNVRVPLGFHGYFMKNI